MSWSDITGYLQNFRTDQVMEQLQAWNIGELNSNPWFLSGFAVAIVICYLIGWRAISAFLVGIGGFALALSWTVSKGTGTEGIESGGLYIIIGGGAVVVALFIYLLFIKSD